MVKVRWARLVSGRPTRSKIIQLATFAKWVANMVRKQGVPGLVQYLKTAHTMLMQGVPGSEVLAHVIGYVSDTVNWTEV
nr:MAG: hypothetical protein H2Bulk364630_000002 [Mitovirus sp.]